MIYSDVSDDCYAYIQYSEKATMDNNLDELHFDIQLVDENGKLQLAIYDFVTRSLMPRKNIATDKASVLPPVQKPVTTIVSTEKDTLYYQPHWHSAPISDAE